TETDTPQLRRLARLDRHALVVYHDPGAAASHHRALLGEIERNDRNVLTGDILPDVEFGPIGEWKHADRFAWADAGVEQVPQLRPLVARVPAVALRAEREDALLGAAFLLIAPRASESGIEAELVQRLPQRLRFHDPGMDRGARRKRAH